MVLSYRRTLAALVAVLGAGATLSAQSTAVQDLAAGKLLVARGHPGDSVFAQSVILVVRYNNNGTMGVMINRPTKVPISKALQELKGASERSDPVYAGGPVELRNVLALLNASAPPEGASRVSGKVSLVSTKALLEKTLEERSTGPREFRVYLGYCGWGPGQLENETRAGFWNVFNGTEDLVFDSDPGTLWTRLVARLGQPIAGLSPFGGAAAKRHAPPQ